MTTSFPDAQPTPPENELQSLIEKLGDEDGLTRQEARLRCEEYGASVIPALIEALSSPNTHTRWEAAKALDTLRDPSSIPALIKALDDDDADVRWLAAEGLINMRQASILPILSALTHNLKSVWLRQGAHHIFHALSDLHQLPPEIYPVMKALVGPEPAIQGPWAAERALEKLSRKK